MKVSDFWLYYLKTKGWNPVHFCLTSTEWMPSMWLGSRDPYPYSSDEHLQHYGKYVTKSKNMVGEFPRNQFSNWDIKLFCCITSEPKIQTQFNLPNLAIKLRYKIGFLNHKKTRTIVLKLTILCESICNSTWVYTNDFVSKLNRFWCLES